MVNMACIISLARLMVRRAFALERKLVVANEALSVLASCEGGFFEILNQ